MPFEPVTAAQWLARMQANVPNNQLDTTYGPIYDSALFPQSIVLSQLSADVAELSQVQSLVEALALDATEEIRAIVSNEGIVPQPGTNATVTLEFQSSVAPPLAGLPVARGTPIGVRDATSTIVFVTTESSILPFGAPLENGLWRLRVQAVAVNAGVESRVGPNRLTRPLVPLNGWSSVTNPAAAIGGDGATTNAQLVDQFFLAVQGRQLATPSGIKRTTLAAFPAVGSVYVDRFPARAQVGAIDVFARNGQSVQRTEQLVYYGVGQLIRVSSPPMLQVNGVTAGATVYVEGTDYEVVFDDTAISGSIRALDGIRFLRTPAAPLAPGGLVAVDYNYDALIRQMQATNENPDETVPGQDLLYRRGVGVPIAIVADFTTRAGFSPVTTQQAVIAAIQAFVLASPQGEPLEFSDVNNAVRNAVSAVNNLIFIQFSRAINFGVADIQFAPNQHPTFDGGVLVVTPR